MGANPASSSPPRRRALVTGGASGIGAAIARRLAGDGVDVTVVDIAGGDGVIQLDVTDVAAVGPAVRSAGRFDILVNNAGVDQFGYFTDTTPDVWQEVVAVNLLGVFACTHAALPAMQQAGWGRIVNVTSEAGRIGAKGNAVYAAAKGGVIAFTKSLARENGRYGITVNAVAPGPIETPLLDRMRQEQGERVIGVLASGTQLRRLGTPGEVAEAVAFLASDAASYITGEILGVSGGMGLGG
ncbi:MAG: SDR family NAD(P)-dependent oxidoreductase [Acidimicrobiales bacterium]